MLLLFLGLETLAYFSDNHEVRRLWIDRLASATATPLAIADGYRREEIGQAIQRWRSANGCTGNAGKCPRPIIIAASGGASRAGFFTAAILGELMDRSIQAETNSFGPFHGPEDFRKQLFAISTVSGSSTGAAFFIAALRHWDKVKSDRSRKERNKPPCKKDADGLVYFEEQPTSWRQCMEQFLAGDFVSPTLYGLVYKDAVRGFSNIARNLGKGMHDRAAILEKAWEDRFCLATTGEACKDDDGTGLSAPFLSASGLGDDTQQSSAWTPILLLNGTDAETGRRVVISPLNPAAGSDERLFSDAYDLHDLLVDETDLGTGPSSLRRPAAQRFFNRDIPLSAAAHMSARFPIVSPPGNVLNAKEQIVSRIINGGYFENYGAATAADIAARLAATCDEDASGNDVCLKPFVIEITNDPEFLIHKFTKKDDQTADRPEEVCKDFRGFDPLKQKDPPFVDADDRVWFSEITSPIAGLMASRGAQGGARYGP